MEKLTYLFIDVIPLPVFCNVFKYFSQSILNVTLARLLILDRAGLLAVVKVRGSRGVPDPCFRYGPP